MSQSYPHRVALGGLVSLYSLGGCQLTPQIINNEDASETGAVATSLSAGASGTTEIGENSGGTAQEVGTHTTSDVDSSGDELGDAHKLRRPRKLDLLLVMDTGPSMADFQTAIAANLPKFIEVLEDPKVRADYRLAVVPAQLAGDACPGPPDGSFTITSCLDRELDFISADQKLARFNSACRAHCPRDFTGPLIRPTTTELDPMARPRPWLESVQGVHNLVNATATNSAALACIGPQGIAGCGYPAPLEAMYRALSRSFDPAAAEYGFLRDDADLVVLIISATDDCSFASHVAAGEGVLSPNNSTFWPTPESGPTPAICWNAGTRCGSESNGLFETCWPVDVQEDGSPATLPDHVPVLHRLERYADLLRSLKPGREGDDGHRPRVHLRLVHGLDLHTSQVIYPVPEPDSTDLHRFGIGSSCMGDTSVLEETDPQSGETIPVDPRVDAKAYPAVRLEAVGATLGRTQANQPICAADYLAPLKVAADRVRLSMTENCMPYCVADTHTESTALDASCTTRLHVPGSTPRDILECKFQYNDSGTDREKNYERDDNYRFVLPSAQAQACFAAQPSRECHEVKGTNLVVYVELRAGVSLPSGAYFESRCRPSPTPELDCPG